MGWMLLEGKYPVKKYLGRVPLGAGEGCVKHADVKEPPAGIRVLIGDTKFNMDTFNNPFLELPKIGDKTQVTCSREAVIVLKN